MRYRARPGKPSVVREPRLPYGTSGNGEWFQAHVVRELQAIRGEIVAIGGEIVAIRREQDTINERLLLLITNVADGVAKLNRRMDLQDRRNVRQDRINDLVFKEFKVLRRRAERQDRRNARQDHTHRLILREIRRLRRRKSA